MMTINDLPEQVKKNGGLTVHMWTMDSPTSGYVVSHEDRETVVPEADLMDPVKGPEILFNYLKANADVLSLASTYLGVWLHEGWAYLDCSQVCNDLDEALDLGERRDQLAIYDLNEDREIPVLAQAA